jgi:hypothetical protein
MNFLMQNNLQDMYLDKSYELNRSMDMLHHYKLNNHFMFNLSLNFKFILI